MNNIELDKIIERSFSIEPGYFLPDGFAQKVTAIVIQRQQWKTDMLEYLYLTGIVAFLFAIVSGTYYWVNKELLLQIFSIVRDNMLQFVFIAFLLNFILFADRVLLRLLFTRWNRI